MSNEQVGQVLERAVRKFDNYVRTRGLVDDAGDPTEEPLADPLCVSAVAGSAPPAGPQWQRGLRALAPRALAYDKPLCASLDGFTLHAATRVGGGDPRGREALLRYVLRPPLAQEHLTAGHNGLVRIALKRAYADGTVAVEMDPLSLLARLAASVPPPRYHTVKYAGVLASASRLRARITPKPRPVKAEATDSEHNSKRSGCYWPWAELLKRTFGVDVLSCPRCNGRMKLLALVTEPPSITRYLTALGEPTDVPARSPSRGPPYWRSGVLRHRALGHVA